MSTLKIKDLHYAKDGLDIVNGVSLDLEGGEVVAILGQNGSGKTTLIDLIVDGIRPTGGEVRMNGMTYAEAKDKVGVVWDNINFCNWLTPKEVIKYVSAMRGISEINRTYYDILGIAGFENRLMRKLSQGERKRVSIYLATFFGPEFLIIDEAMTDLDPMTRKRVWEKIILAKDRMVLFTTHQWEEAELYATKIAFIDKGRILHQPCSGQELLAESGLKQKLVLDKSAVALLDDNLKDYFVYFDENLLHILLRDENDPVIDAIKARTFNYSLLPITLNDLYHYYTLQK